MATKSELRNSIYVTTSIPDPLRAGTTSVHQITLENRWNLDIDVRVTSDSGNGSLRYPKEPDPMRWHVDRVRLTASSRRFGGGPTPFTMPADVHNDPAVTQPSSKVNQVTTQIWHLDGSCEISCGAVFINVPT